MDYITISRGNSPWDTQACRYVKQGNPGCQDTDIKSRTVIALVGAGIYGFNGVSPITSKKIIDIFVMPRLTYGLETLVITKKRAGPHGNILP